MLVGLLGRWNPAVASFRVHELSLAIINIKNYHLLSLTNID